MATTRSFNTMLNEYLPNDMLMEELLKRDYLLSTIGKDEDWKGGDTIVPFRGALASSIKFGALTASNDIAEGKYVRGKINAYKEVWGSMIFNQTDLMQHDGKMPESTFLKILPDTLEDFLDNFKETVSFQLMAGPHFATVTSAAGAASGIMVVDRIDKFIIDQKVTLDDGDSPVLDVYVKAIDVNTNSVTLSDTRGGSAYNVSAYSVAQAAKFYFDGVWDGTTSSSFISLKNAFLSAANGGDATLHGQTKTAYPYLQAVNVLGSDITATNILDKIFDAYVTIRIKARGKATKVLCSYKHWGSIMKSQQIEKGAYKLVNDPKRSEYGWFELTLASTTKGEALSIVAVQEMPDDIIIFLDPTSVKFLSNGGFRKNADPEGKLYYPVRATTGYSYIVDMCLFGELQVTKPSNNGILHTISY